MASKITNHFEVLFIDEEDIQKSNKEQGHWVCEETVTEIDELDLGIEDSSDSDMSLGPGQSPSELNIQMEECVEVQSKTGTEVELEKNSIDNDQDQTKNKIAVEGNSGETETEIVKAVLNEVEMSRNQQGMSTEKMGDVIYADQLLSYITYGKVVKGKRQIKWNGNLEELQSFVDLVLKLKGKWKETGKKPSTQKHVFIEQNGGPTLNWWPSTQTISIQGSMPEKTDIEDKIGGLLKNHAVTEPDTIIDHELPENLGQDASEKKQTTTSQDSFKKLWKAINEIKSIIGPAHATKIVDSDINKVKKNAICTGVNTKESLITNYFKPIDKAKHQQQNQRVLKILQLEAKCSKLEKEKWELTKQLAQLKLIENTQKSKHQNTETNGKHQAKEQPKQNKVKKKQKKKRTLTAQTLPYRETDQPAQQQQQQQQSKQDQSHPDRQQQQQHQQQEEKHRPNYCGIEKNEQVDNKGQQRKSTVIIAGDSIVKNLNGWMISRAKRVKVHSFSGATTTEMKHFIKPLVQRKPSEIILHVGTNDVDIHSTEEVADNIIKLTDDIKKEGIRCTVSSLVVRADSELLKSAVIDVNNVLRDSLPQDVNFVEHSNITNYHLNNSRLHLNRRGDAALAHNFIQHIRSSNC